MEHNVPNLDGMDRSALWAFWREHNGPRSRNVRDLFPDGGPGTQVATRELACYASNKATAMGLRESGDVQGAMRYEAICDRIYDGLPDEVKW